MSSYQSIAHMEDAVVATFRITDMLYFFAELLVYVALAWWGFTRAVPVPIRWCLGLGGVTLFAASWGVFAAPRASIALHGAAGTSFRLVWFGIGAAAAVTVVTSKWSATVGR